MRFLLDTNVLIASEPVPDGELEDGTPASLELARVAAGEHQLLVHPSVSDEIAHDTNVARRQQRQLVRDRYVTLEHPPVVAPELVEVLGTAKPGSHDWYDNQLLASVAADAVHGLITQDEGIHKKARRLGLDDRVHTLADAVSMLSGLSSRPEIFDPIVETVPLHTLDLSDPIFDSLKLEYEPFTDWFANAARSGRKAFVFRDPTGGIGGICIFKAEPDHEIDLGRNPCKVSTFKVSDELKGSKYGELLLKVLLKRVQGMYDLVWLTVYPQHEHLLEFLRTFGFEVVGKKPTGELKLAKRLEPTEEETADQSPLEFHVRYGPPAIRIKNGQVLLIPIRPEFHESLFPDAPGVQMTLPGPRPHGNALRKAYLSRANLRGFDPGATLLFYRSGDVQSVTAVGVLEASLGSGDPDEILRFVGRRTVYSTREVEEMTSDGEVLALLFRQDRFLDRPLTLHELVENKVIGAPPQTTIRTNSDGLEWLKNRLEG